MSVGESAFSIGSRVRVRSRDDLQRLARGWQWQPSVNDEVLRQAGRVAVVVEVTLRPNGIALYALDPLPGLWDEAWLEDGAGGERRLLPQAIADLINGFPESSYGAQTVRVVLGDGTCYSGVVVAGSGVVVRVTGYDDIPFDPQDVVSATSEV